MTPDAIDPTLRGLRRLTVLEPDAARSERVRRRCRIALAERRQQDDRSTTSGRSRAAVLESGLLYGLSVSYLFAVIGDLVRAYLRR